MHYKYNLLLLLLLLRGSQGWNPSLTSAEGDAHQPQAETHGDGHLQVAPLRSVVPRPHRPCKDRTRRHAALLRDVKTPAALQTLGSLHLQSHALPPSRTHSPTWTPQGHAHFSDVRTFVSTQIIVALSFHCVCVGGKRAKCFHGVRWRCESGTVALRASKESPGQDERSLQASRPLHLPLRCGHVLGGGSKQESRKRHRWMEN